MFRSVSNYMHFGGHRSASNHWPACVWVHQWQVHILSKYSQVYTSNRSPKLSFFFFVVKSIQDQIYFSECLSLCLTVYSLRAVHAVYQISSPTANWSSTHGRWTELLFFLRGSGLAQSAFNKGNAVTGWIYRRETSQWIKKNAICWKSLYTVRQNRITGLGITCT